MWITNDVVSYSEEGLDSQIRNYTGRKAQKRRHSHPSIQSINQSIKHLYSAPSRSLLRGDLIHLNCPRSTAILQTNRASVKTKRMIVQDEEKEVHSDETPVAQAVTGIALIDGREGNGWGGRSEGGCTDHERESHTPIIGRSSSSCW